MPNVCFGSLKDIGARGRDCPLYLARGHRQLSRPCLPSANSRPDWAYRSRPLSGASNTMGILTARLSVRVVVATVRGDEHGDGRPAIGFDFVVVLCFRLIEACDHQEIGSF